MEPRLARLARVLLTWSAAFLIVVALLSAFGQQLKAMSLQLRALTVSGVLVIAMNVLVMPTLSRLLSRFPGPGTPSEGHSLRSSVLASVSHRTRVIMLQPARASGSRTSITDLRLEPIDREPVVVGERVRVRCPGVD
jgi:hypothetical protein